MKLIDTTCPYCGAKMKVDAEKKHIVCEYCGSTLIMEEEKTVSSEDRGYQYEMGRQKAREDYKQQKQREAQQAARRKKFIWLWVLGWIYFFPIALTILIARNKNMNPKLKKWIIAGVWGFVALITIIALIAGVVETSKEGAESEVAVVQEQTTDVEEALEHYDESLKGRGESDKNRTEPEYVNIIGYAVVSDAQTNQLQKQAELLDAEEWTVPKYVKDKQFWNEDGSIPNGTEVIVREQALENKNLYGKYKGYLLVERTDTKEQCYIDVENFVTRPYWTYVVDEAVKTGDFVAEFNQKSDYYPVDDSGKKLEISDGTRVLVTGTPMSTGTIKPKETGITAYIWMDGKSRKCFINSQDLTIVWPD